MCHEISVDTHDIVNIITLFSSAGEDKLIAEMAIIGKEFNTNCGQAISDFNNNCVHVTSAITGVATNFNSNSGQVTSAITGVAKEIKEILYICKCAAGISAVVAGVCGINYAWRQWKK
jgi:hypothetical protein